MDLAPLLHGSTRTRTSVKRDTETCACASAKYELRRRRIPSPRFVSHPRRELTRCARSQRSAARTRFMFSRITRETWSQPPSFPPSATATFVRKGSACTYLAARARIHVVTFDVSAVVVITRVPLSAVVLWGGGGVMRGSLPPEFRLSKNVVDFTINVEIYHTKSKKKRIVRCI